MFHDLVRLETELWNRANDRLLAAHDLPLSWLEVMSVIDDTTHCRVGDISQRLIVTVGGTSKLVDRIEAAGLSRRTRNPLDRRSHYIELTPAGRRLLKSGRRTLAVQLAHDVRAADPEQVYRLADALAHLRQALAPQISEEAAPQG